jgi:predicted SAM-dependent methyltransferase
LRGLQRQYYTSTRERVAELFPAYTVALAEARSLYLDLLVHPSARLLFASVRPPADRGVRLHLGCGDHYLDGWINVDLGRDGDLVADLARPLPLRSRTVSFIHSEDFLEHIELEAGRRFLAECFRVLVPSGVMRLLTPDLWAIVTRVYLGREGAHLAWCEAFLAAGTPCEALNMHMRMEGGAHRFVYDYEFLSRLLQETGFVVRRVSYNASRHPALRFLDLRDFGLNLFIEATKPKSS